MKRIGTILLVVIICLIGAIFMNDDDSNEKQPSNIKTDGDVSVHIIDVGQGDGIWINTGKENIVIDSGTKSNGQTLINYLENHDVKQLDAVISTHPDADHVGGLADVINHFPVKSVYAPRVTHTTQAYKAFLTAVKAQNLKIKVAKQGVTIPSNAEGVTLSFVGPTKDYSTSDLNDWSAVLEMTHGEKKFLFPGDAETRAEEDMVAAGVLDDVDFLKVSHHGAREASNTDYLNVVKPEIAAISVGEGNRYGHPTDEALKRLKAAGAKIYRTDEHGSLTFISDGKSISVEEER
ncbi:ComEC/Rec2 family competence protein [Kurthia massiliensis]|uniref:ComEC/Rec2 family competence protein n=1 Tax=Kurthia massiliensis TaxID=1033739 RepID=UPI000289D72E|nr:ComEC/Rec2 family competence protein [Kurthia massiliensis]